MTFLACLSPAVPPLLGPCAFAARRLAPIIRQQLVSFKPRSYCTRPDISAAPSAARYVGTAACSRELGFADSDFSEASSQPLDNMPAAQQQKVVLAHAVVPLPSSPTKRPRSDSFADFSFAPKELCTNAAPAVAAKNDSTYLASALRSVVKVFCTTAR